VLGGGFLGGGGVTMEPFSIATYLADLKFRQRPKRLQEAFVSGGIQQEQNIHP
jgi:hypothetical protein